MANEIKIIPIKTSIDNLSLMYRKLEKRIKDLMFSIRPQEYTELKAMKVTNEIELLFFKFNKIILKWVEINTKKAYKISENYNIKVFERNDYEKNPQFVESDHINTINKYIDLTFKDLLKANSSIINSVTIFMQTLKNLSKETVQIQELDSPENLADEILGNKKILGVKINFTSLDAIIRKGGKTRKQISDLILKRLKKKIW